MNSTVEWETGQRLNQTRYTPPAIDQDRVSGSGGDSGSVGQLARQKLITSKNLLGSNIYKVMITKGILECNRKNKNYQNIYLSNAL